MRKDFTVIAYRKLIRELGNADYELVSFEQFMRSGPGFRKQAILRHDVDKYPKNALNLARVEQEVGATASYYFRIVKASFDEAVIREVISLGHEVGYHYEDVTLAKGDLELARRLFVQNLEHFRSLYPVKTICMHGSPLTKWDNRELWSVDDYRTHGLIGEPYYDLDFDEVLYLTDTGRGWNRERFSRRDKVETNLSADVDSTWGLIEAIRGQRVPDKLLINTHPQRWSDRFYPWARELVLQNLKNQYKRAFLTKSGR